MKNSFEKLIVVIKDVATTNTFQFEPGWSFFTEGISEVHGAVLLLLLNVDIGYNYRYKNILKPTEDKTNRRQSYSLQ